MLEIVSHTFENVPLLSLAGELDHASAADFQGEAEAALGRDGNRLLLQLTDCPYMDSGGISTLLALLRRVRPDGWLGLIAPNADVRRLLDLVGLTLSRDLLVFSNLPEAQAYVGVSLGCRS